MSNQLFDRKIEIAFGVPGKPGNKYSGLRVEAKLELTSNSSPNKGKIKVFNLNSKSRALSEVKGLVFILKAGYGTNLSTIFSGDIARASSSLEGDDIVTTFEIGDGETAYREARTDASFDAGVSIKTVFQDVVKSLGKAVGDLSSVTDGTFLNGITLSGHAREHMDYLTKKQGLEWSIQDDTVRVVKKGKSTVEEAVLLTPKTGLIEIPKKKDQGIEFKCLLQAKIKPFRAVRIESKNLTGNYRCERVKIDIDNLGGKFICDVEALPI